MESVEKAGRYEIIHKAIGIFGKDIHFFILDKKSGKIKELRFKLK